MNYDEGADFADKRKFINDLFELLTTAGIEDYGDWLSLEVGGEGGVLAGLLASRFAHVVSSDIVHAQFVYGGDFLGALREKFKRQNERMQFNKVEFLTADAQNLPFRDAWFHFCFSQNAFEHIADPELALLEAFRVTRPGGFVYVMFDPVWTADSGSHFLEAIGEPWLHLIETDEEITRRMLSRGASALDVKHYCSHMNRRPVNYYREMFARVVGKKNATVVYHHDWSGCVDPSYLDHPNLDAAAQFLNLTHEQLLVRGFRYLIKLAG